jgi:phage shock protein A
MSLFHRIKTNVKAAAHGVVDALEDRALLLRQYLRDAEAELLCKRGQLQVVETELRSLEREANSTQAELQRFEADAEVALGAGNDELSRFALKGVLVRRARQRRQAARREELARERQEVSRLLSEQSERYVALKERVEAELQAAGSGCEASFEAISEEQVELELLRRKRQGVAS